MTSDSLRVVSEPPDPREKAQPHKRSSPVKAMHRRPRRLTRSAPISSVRLVKDQFYAYGLGGRDVVVVNQAHPGQP